MSGICEGRRHTWGIRGLGAVVLGGTLLAACADAGTPRDPSEDGAPTVEVRGSLPVAQTRLVESNGNPVTMTFEDTFFDPTYVTGPPGTRVELRLRNLSSRDHNFSMENTTIDVDLHPAEERTITVNVPSSGFEVFFCKYHTAAGMNGQLLPTGSQPIPVDGTPRAIP